MLIDKFTPKPGWNSLYSEIENFEVRQSPLNNGFNQDRFFFYKRKGLFTLQNSSGTYQWRTDADIVYAKLINDIVYLYDTSAKVYKFTESLGVFTLTNIYNPGLAAIDIYDEDLDGDKVAQRIVELPYIVNKFFTATVDAVNTTNDDGSGNVVLAVNEASTFASTDVFKYIYIPSSATTGAYQIRQIIEYVDGKTVYLNDLFYDLPSASDPVHGYTAIENVKVFFNIRNSDGEVLTIDSSDNEYFRAFGGKDICLFNGRLWTVNLFGTQLEGSLLTGEYEIKEPLAAVGYGKDNKGEKMSHIYPYSDYILSFYDNKISALYNVGQDTSGNDIYRLSTLITGMTTLTVDSVGEVDGGFYYISNTKKLYSLGISRETDVSIKGVVKNSGLYVQNYLNSFDTNGYTVIYEDADGLNIMNVSGNNSLVLRYNSQYQGWLTNRYSKGLGIGFISFGNDFINFVGKDITTLTGVDDLGENISQRIVIYGPYEEEYTPFILRQIKILLGYYGNQINFKGILDLGGDVLSLMTEFDSNGAGWIYLSDVGSGEMLGSSLIGTSELGEDDDDIMSSTSKLGLIGLKVNRRAIYYKLTLENIENSYLNIGGIAPQFTYANPNTVPIINKI